MTLFLLSISCVGRELFDVIASIRQLSLSFHWWFQGLQGLCFHWWFMDQQWQSIFANSMRQPWLIFANDLMCRSWIQWRCLFHTSAVTQFSVTISRSRVTQFLLTIFGQYGSGFHWRFRASTMTLFSSDFMRPPWISFRCWFHASSATQFSMMISHSMVT
jgi:hypothetical protein